MMEHLTFLHILVLRSTRLKAAHRFHHLFLLLAIVSGVLKFELPFVHVVIVKGRRHHTIESVLFLYICIHVSFSCCMLVSLGQGIQIRVQWSQTTDPLHVRLMKRIFSCLSHITLLAQALLALVVKFRPIFLVSRLLHQPGHCIVRNF